VAGAAAATPPAALALAQEPDDDATTATSESSLALTTSVGTQAAAAAAAAAAEERDRALYEQSDAEAAAGLLQLSQARLLRVLQYYRDLQESTQRAATHLEASLLRVSYAGASPATVLEGDSNGRRPSSRHIERRPTLLLEGSVDSVQQQQQRRRSSASDAVVVLPTVSAESSAAAAVMRSQSAGGNSTEPTAVVTRHRMQVLEMALQTTAAMVLCL
jgi:hypothetical protein